ncbi:hypothetical protein CLOM621_08967 [Clostridium sp. M62/1]|nr:hypothetical protein CLOM621_08967 [Clostridium sp. M62/1]
MYLFCGQLHYSQLFSGAFAGLLVCVPFCLYLAALREQAE